MKKLTTLALALLMVVSLLAVSASADSFIENDYCQASFEIKKANPDNVIKDGIIGEGEYTRVEVSKADLCINFGSSTDYTRADLMADSLEYYFSWDDVHGLNFAVVYDAADGCQTNVDQYPIDSDGRMKDNFCFNVGLNFVSGGTRDDGMSYFYYSIGKKIQDNTYLKGHWNQLGSDASYDPVGGRDFEISYNGTVVTYEWSVPFAQLGYVGAAGNVIDISLSACAGTATAEENDDTALSTANASWSVSLGQNAFGCASSRTAQPAKATLSDELIPGGSTGTTAGQDGTTPAPTQTTEVITSIVTEQVVVTDDKGEAVTDEKGDVVTEVITSVVTQPSANNQAGVTGDPAVIAAVVAAISACGVVVAKKRK